MVQRFAGFHAHHRQRARQIIPLLNDYAEAIISAVTNGGDVLKLIGDGTRCLRADAGAACRRARGSDGRASGSALNARRANEPTVTDLYLGLHIGEVFYGNIGSRDRLDFTVVGPAVNEASRIAAMCRSAEQRC